MPRAPVELVLIEFPGNQFKGAILDEIARLVESGTINLLDLLLIRKDADGDVDWFELEDVVEDSALTRLMGGSLELLAVEDVDAVADELEANSSIGMMVFEHAWAARLTSSIKEANGRLIDWARVPAAAITELEATLAKEA